MASPKTIAFNKGVEARSAAVRAQVSEEYAKTHPSKPRKSHRWVGRRTKGMPFSRMTLVDMTPGIPGRPALLQLAHPTRKTPGTRMRATPALLAVFFPSLPPQLTASMLGH